MHYNCIILLFSGSCLFDYGVNNVEKLCSKVSPECFIVFLAPRQFWGPEDDIQMEINDNDNDN